MDSYLIRDDMAFVSADGDYGQGIIIFQPDLLTDKQWERVSDMHDSDRADYVSAILTGNEEAIAEFEKEWDEIFGEEED